MSSSKKITKTSRLHYNKAKVIACPQCKVAANMSCVRVDGKNGQPHVARVLKWEKDLQ